jgi:hypothetical protein
LMIFLWKFLWEMASKSSFSRRDSTAFGAAISVAAVVRNSSVFRNSASADRSGLAVLRLLAAASACVVLLRFAAEC